jgi:hypothetical protein
VTRLLCFLRGGHKWARVQGTATFWCRRCPEVRNVLRETGRFDSEAAGKPTLEATRTVLEDLEGVVGLEEW